MVLPLTLLVGFLSLVWLGLMLLNLAGVVSAGNDGYEEGKNLARVLVIVPCKGRDATLEENLLSLKEQNYRNYKIIAVVDSESDKAVGPIKRAGIDYIISEKGHAEGSGKVAAIITAIRRFSNFDIYVNVDSDVYCKKGHISSLVSPLADRRIGVATAYPYFNPIGGFWSKVKMAWGFVGNGMMESTVTRFVWGGSMAFRKDLIGASDFKVFRKAVSDDMAVSHFARKKGLAIAFVDKHMISVNTDDNMARFLEWSNRQTALSILGNRRVLYYGLLFYSAQALLLVFGAALSLYSLWYLILLLPFAIGIAKTYRRAGRLYLSLIPIAFIMNFIFLANLIVGAGMKSIEWRGSVYRLRDPFQG